MMNGAAPITVAANKIDLADPGIITSLSVTLYVGCDALMLGCMHLAKKAIISNRARFGIIQISCRNSACAAR